MMIVLLRVSASIALCSRSSFSGSTFAVASSRMTMGAFFSMERAMAMRCRFHLRVRRPGASHANAFPDGIPHHSREGGRAGFASDANCRFRAQRTALQGGLIYPPARDKIKNAARLQKSNQQRFFKAPMLVVFNPRQFPRAARSLLGCI